MATTIVQTPDSIAPVFNPMDYLISSTNTAQSNFKYICDVYINGSSSFTRLTKSADPTFGRGHFNVESILRDYVATNISRADDGIETNNNSYVSYICKFGEQYGLSSSGVTNYPNQSTDATRYGFNGMLDYLQNTQYDELNYTANTSANFRFLTNQPTTLTIRNDDYRWLYFMSAITSGVTSIRIDTYNSSNVLLQTVYVDNTFKTLSDEKNRFLRIPAGVNLNNIDPAQIISGAQPIITASVAYYTMTAHSTTITYNKTAQTFLINNECSRHSKYTLHFKNKLGGFDTKDFIYLSKTKSDIVRDTYKQVTGTLASTSFTYSASDRANTVYNTLINEQTTINSNWLKEDEQQWLGELIESPEVYHDHDTYGLVPINIIDRQYQYDKRTNNKSMKLELTFEYNFNRYRR